MPERLEKETKVKFGAIRSGGTVVQNGEWSEKSGSYAMDTETGSIPQHAAFGVEGVDVVEDLRKGAPYV